MTTKNVVQDGKLSNEQLGGLQRRYNEITRRVNEGTLMYEPTMTHLQQMIEGKGNVCPFPIWKTIKLGTGLKSAADFRKAIKQSGYNIGDWANDILGKPAFSASKTEMELDLVNVSVADLGFKNGAKLCEIYNRAKELGLALCPAEVGPQLRLQYLDQPNDEWLRVAMDPIAHSARDLGIFYVGRSDDGVRWLDATYGRPEDFWDAAYRFVFVCPRLSSRA